MMQHARTATRPSSERLHVFAVVLPIALALLVACTQSSSETSSGSTTSVPIAAGDVAPDFTLPSAKGEEISLADFAGKQPVLLYFSMGPG
jgi:cytochrome oxidase Cu insertion factor (SCO1/SenC/PrrC family)